MATRGILVALLALSMVLVLVPSAVGSEGFRVHPHQDLLFTDISGINDILLLGTDGYIAATNGGLVLWTGEGPRQVLTRMDDLPSNIVWEVAETNEGYLVATESGAVLVDPVERSVRRLDASDEVQVVTASHTTKARVVNDTWYLMDRAGELAIRAPDGSWRTDGTTDQHITGRWSNDLATDGEHVFMAREARLNTPAGRAIFELVPGQGWQVFDEPEEQPVRLSLHEEVLYVGTRGDGLIAYDLQGERLDLQAPAALSNLTVTRIVPFGQEIWVGSTEGIFIHTPETGAWRHVGPELLANPSVTDLVPLESRSQGASHDRAVVGHETGLAWPRFDVHPHFYEVHRTVNGPTNTHFRSATNLDGEIWAGSNDGVAIYYPDHRLWWSYGPPQGLVHAPVHDADRQGGITWLAAEGGIWGLDPANGSWHVWIDDDPVLTPGNLYFDIEADGPDIWFPEFGNALMRWRFAENESSQYQIPQGLLSHGVTCADRWQEYLAVCSTEAMQFFNLSRSSPEAPLGRPWDFCNQSACGNNYPAANTHDTLPDGPRVWMATADNGVVLVERGLTGGLEVTGHWNETDGLPHDQVRALAHAEGGVWAGTARGLVLLRADEGVVETWDRRDSLDDPVIQGLAEHDGILYVSTLSGLYRLDIEAGEFLPLHEGRSDFGRLQGRITVSFPTPGAVLRHDVNVTGTADVPGRSVDHVEVRTDDGDWSPAQGTNAFTFRLLVSELTTGQHRLQMRAIADERPMAWRNLTVEVQRPEGPPIPPTLVHQPPSRAFRGQTLFLDAVVDGERPMTAALEAQLGGEVSQIPGRIVAGVASFQLQIPQDVVGDLTYRFHLRSGAGDRVFPAESSYRVPVEEPIRRGLQLELRDADGTLIGPEDAVTVPPGGSADLLVTVVNTGNRVDEVELASSGFHGAWLDLVEAQLVVPPKDPLSGADENRRTVDATLSVPADAPDGTTLISVTARSLGGESSASQAVAVNVPVRSSDPGSQGPDPGQRGTPAPAYTLLLSLVAGAVASRGRRRDT